MTIKAEMWDKMQDIMARYNDHMTHIYIAFNNRLELDLIKKAFIMAVDKVPVLKCVYKPGIFKAVWQEIKDYCPGQLFNYAETDGDPYKLAERFLLGKIDETREAQIKALFIRSGNKDALAILINPQCFDGADIKEFMYLLAKIYNGLKDGGDGGTAFKNGSRDDRQIYKYFTPEQQKELDKLVSYSKKQKHRISYPFEKAAKADLYPQINSLTLGGGEYKKLKDSAKKYGVSVNDAVLAAFYRATVRFIKLKPGETLGIPNMVNLRRYIPSGESEGMCNLTSMVVSNIGEDIGWDIFETVKKVKSNMDALKGNYPGLHGIPLLRKVLKYTPYALAKFLIGTFFKNPLIGVSNIGIIDDKKLSFSGAGVESSFITGSVKYPPYMQLALSTYRDTVTFTVANYGTDNDHKMFNKMLAALKEELTAFFAEN